LNITCADEKEKYTSVDGSPGWDDGVEVGNSQIEIGWQYGFGLEVKLGDKYSLSARYFRMRSFGADASATDSYDASNLDVQGYSLGLIITF
jgi:opacity protein-like surface antigen